MFKSKNKNAFLVLGFGMVAVCFVMAILFIISMADESNFYKTCESTEGVVTKLEDNSIYISYTVNGVKYDNIKVKWSEYDLNLNSGDIVTVYYNPYNYEETGLGIGGYIVDIILFVIFVGVGVFFIVIGIKPKITDYYLMKKGIEVETTVINVYKNTNLIVKGESPYIVVCEYIDPATGKGYFFRSENVWGNTPSVNDKVSVYISRKNNKFYYVNI